MFYLTAVNPTFKQMIDFVKADQTDKIPYINSSFACSDFAEKLHNNAEKAGYKCAFVSLYFLAGRANPKFKIESTNFQIPNFQ